MNSLTVVGVAPLRKEPSHRSEMVSQLLFGEGVQVTETSGDFAHIINSYDGYTGWCQQNQLKSLLPGQKLHYPGQLVSVFAGAVNWQNMVFQVPGGSPVVQVINEDGTIAKDWPSYDQTPIVQVSNNGLTETAIQQWSSLYINAPYLWGGRSPWGIDCSGFVQQVFRFMGIDLLRDASMQAGQGQEGKSLQETRCGDLAFFDNEAGKIVHVGILTGSGEIIHSAGQVRRDPIDEQGIIHVTSRKRTHKLRLIRRVS